MILPQSQQPNDAAGRAHVLAGRRVPTPDLDRQSDRQTDMHACIHTCIHTFMHACLHACMQFHLRLEYKYPRRWQGEYLYCLKAPTGGQ